MTWGDPWYDRKDVLGAEQATDGERVARSPILISLPLELIANHKRYQVNPAQTVSHLKQRMGIRLALGNLDPSPPDQNDIPGDPHTVMGVDPIPSLSRKYEGRPHASRHAFTALL